KWVVFGFLFLGGGGGCFLFLPLAPSPPPAARAVLVEYPVATAILADFSTHMMAEGANQLAPFAGRYRYVEFDMLSSDWPSEIPVPLDAVVSALSIHHLPDPRKQSIFVEIRRRLKPNGWYINYDPIRPPDAVVESTWERVNDRYDTQGPLKRANRTPTEQARYENHIRYMIPLQPQLEWLRASGFTPVEVFWKRLDWVIYGGRNPG
ncbi:MAG: class I SAM-dependent methyltransferase, partial [Chloroflexota bacterium]